MTSNEGTTSNKLFEHGLHISRAQFGLNFRIYTHLPLIPFLFCFYHLEIYGFCRFPDLAAGSTVLTRTVNP